MKTIILVVFTLPALFLTRGNNSNALLKKNISTKISPDTFAHPLTGIAGKENPVIPGDLADPSILRKGNTYFATGTSSEWAPHFPLFESTDLIHWKQKGYALMQTPAWAASSFWAPELFYWKNTWYLYYVAKRKSDGISCIGVATTTDINKGFTDRGIMLEYGKEAIDPFVIEEEGKLFMTWKAYGLDSRPIEILGCQLSEDGLKGIGEPFSLLRDEGKKGIEGQCMVKRDGYYYLFYSLGACCGRNCSYQVEVARSASLQGPYTAFERNPILTETTDWKCPGHGTLVEAKDGNMFYLYHAYSKSDHVYTGRQGMLAGVHWNAQSGWPSIKPMGEKAATPASFRDDFSAAVITDSWQWDFRNAQPEWKLQNGQLSLSGKSHSANPTGTALTVRPLTGNYEIRTGVINQNASLKGLVLYGDAGQSVGIGTRGNSIEIWEVKKQVRSVLNEVQRVGAKQLYLKMKVAQGYQCRFFWSEDDKNWKEINTSGEYYNGEFLPPWDRSPRPGVMHKGLITELAVFSFFEVRYL